MTQTDTIKLNIDEKALSYAKIYSSLLADSFQRKRAYASIAALYALINLVEKTDYDIQKSMTIFRNPILNEQYEISDLYINNWHIDVRIVTEGDSFLVPKIHFDANIIPDFYAVIKVDKNLSSAELIGFADTKTMQKEGFDYHYYSVANNSLMKYEEFLNAVNYKKIINFKEEDHNLFKEYYLSLMDNELDQNTKNKILKHLFNCSECRTEFCCFTGFEMVSCNLSKYPDIFEDQTLNIIGAQAANSSKYEGKEETIHITDDKKDNEEQHDKDEKFNDNKQDQEETVSDILDELFNTDEDVQTIKETSQEKPVIDNISTEDIIEQEDFDILNEDPNSSTEIIDLDNNNDTIDIIIEDNQNNKNFSEEELNLIEESFLDINKKQDLVFIDDAHTSEIENIEETIPEIITEEPTIIEDKKEEDKVEKVIVDYDDFGEPIYSYITNVTESEPEQNISKNEEKNENNTDIEIEEIEQDNNSDNETQNNINDSSSDYVISDKYNHSIDKEQDNTKEIDEKYEEDPLFSEEDLSKEYEDEDFSDFKEEEYQEDKEYTEEEIEDNNSEYEEKIDLKKKKGLLTGLFLLLLIIVSGGAFFAMKYINAATQVNDKETASQTEIPNTAVTNNMFEQSEEDGTNENDIIAANETNNKQASIPIEEITSSNSIEIPPTGNIEIPAADNIATQTTLTEKDLLTNQKPTGDVNKVMSNAFSTGVNTISIRGVNWMCAPNLFTDKIFKNYLQNLDSVLKLNLRKNILNTMDNPTNNSVVIKMAIDNNGNLLKTLVATSSGSEEIDNIVLQSIKETVESQKSPILNDSEQKSDKYFLQVVIKL